MKPGFGEVLLAEGDPWLREDEERLVEEFRRQLDEGMWAAVPTVSEGSGRREAQMVRDFGDSDGRRARDLLPPRSGRLSREAAPGAARAFSPGIGGGRSRPADAGRTVDQPRRGEGGTEA